MSATKQIIMADIEMDKCDFCKQVKPVQRIYLRPSVYVKPEQGYLKLHNEGDYFIIIKTCSDCGTPADQCTSQLREELEAEKEKVEVYRRSIGRTEQDYILEISRKDKALVSVRSELEAAKKRVQNLLGDVDVWSKEVDRLNGLVLLAHARGWNDAIGNKITWSDTSFNNFKSEHNL